MQFDWWTFAFQVINLLVLMWLLGRFMFRPVADIIARRQDETTKRLEAAEARQRQAAKAEAATLAEREKFAAERVTLMQAARADAEALRKSILEKARRDAEAAAQSMQADAERRMEEDRHDRERRAVDLAVVIADRLLAHLPADGRIAGYPERLRRALADLSTEQQQAFSDDLGAMRFVAPRSLDAAEYDQAARALADVFPAGPRPPVDVDPSLIAGLELRGRHSVVHNSLGHDLTRISEALIRHADI